MNRLWQAADKAKLVLSANTETRISVESLYDDIDFRALVTREEFEDYTSENFGRINLPLINALSEFDINNLKSVILAGGSTRVPFVQKHLTTFLGSDDMIAKNVNADEAAVIGATYRGVSMAGMFRSKAANVTDIIFSDFEISYDPIGSRYPEFVSIFPAESNSLGASKSVVLDKLNGSVDDVEVTLYNSGKTICKHILSNKYNESSCPSGTEFNLTFSLSDSKIFSLKQAYMLCHTDPTNTTLTKKTYLTDKTEYDGYKPMTPHIKQNSITKLKNIAKKEKQRWERDEAVNNLESSLYDLRGFLEEDEVLSRGPLSLINKADVLVSQYLEWLEFDSDGATTADIKEKTEEVQILKIKIKTYTELSDELLSLSEFEKMCNKTNEMVFKMQDFMLSISQQED
ncbi:unnamed protein product [Ambrosiozyma monospora]|uniref:Unnamed protein product n=1 Tax=Ambrosiozyma monospora TaxID=43982 RepID=A0ACB5TLD0_AMBMO|nr:unnamed protein product [Ambrosiozyma monospora]